jgi:hypothetical protein
MTKLTILLRILTRKTMKMMLMTMATLTGSSCQIKARVTQIVQKMAENLPFLTGNPEHPSRSARPQSENEWPAREDQQPSNFQPMAVMHDEPRSKLDLGDFFKNTNPMAILLLGIVIGVIVVSMRPIVIQPK